MYLYEFSTDEGLSGRIMLNEQMRRIHSDQLFERVSHLVTVGLLTSHAAVIEELELTMTELGYDVHKYDTETVYL